MAAPCPGGLPSRTVRAHALRYCFYSKEPMMTQMTQMSETGECMPDGVWPVGKKAALFSTVIVFGLGMFDFIDRQVLASIIPYLKAEWQITDTEVGMLIAIVNVAMPIMVIPSAYFIDRWSRKKMLAIMGAVWSLATGACALAGTYAHLLTARFFIGAGEAGYCPVAVSLLSASYPKKLRGTAVSLSQLGMTLGVPLGTMIGAYIATRWGWRHAFGIVMVPGLVLALLALFIKDYQTAPVAEHGSGLSFAATIRELVGIPSLLLVVWGAVMTMMFNSSTMNWLPSYFLREGGLPLTQASIFAAMVTACSLLGTLISGPLIDFVRRYTAHAVPVVLSAGLFTGTILFGVGYGLLQPGSTLQLIILCLAQLFAVWALAGQFIAVVELARPEVRATATSVVIFGQNVFGFALGPVITLSLIHI